MFILDNLLLSPLLWIFREIHESVQKEQAGEAEEITRSLSDLYMKLDSGVITEQEFETVEAQLLDRLDAIRDRNEALAREADESDDDSDSEESFEEECQSPPALQEE